MLKLERVGRHDNFFELGGHSLLAVRVVTRLRQALGVEVAIRDLFAHPVLADLARQSGERRARRAAADRAVPNGASVCRCRLRSSGCGFWRRWRGSARPITFRFGLRLKGDLDRAALRRALDRILVRHEVLRTTFAFVDGAAGAADRRCEDSRFASARTRPARAQRCAERNWTGWPQQEASASFDLEAGPLIRGRLIRLGEDEHVLLITMHHIVSDGWSMGVLHQRAERAVRRLSARRGRSSAGAGDPVCRLRGLAAAVDRRRDPAAAGRLLEDRSGRSSGAAGAAGRSSASGAAGLCRRLCGAGAG